MKYEYEGSSVNFNWGRIKLFDKLSAFVIYEQILGPAEKDKVLIANVTEKPAKKFRPFPLNTIDL